VAIVVLAGVLAYANSRSGPFIFDDDATVAKNASIRDLRSTAVFFPEREMPRAGPADRQRVGRDQPRDRRHERPRLSRRQHRDSCLVRGRVVRSVPTHVQHRGSG